MASLSATMMTSSLTDPGGLLAVETFPRNYIILAFNENKFGIQLSKITGL